MVLDEFFLFWFRFYLIVFSKCPIDKKKTCICAGTALLPDLQVQWNIICNIVQTSAHFTQILFVARIIVLCCMRSLKSFW